MVAVAAFARKTGDYRSLSVVDLKVLALTYELDCEQVLLGGGEKGCGGHLRSSPRKGSKKAYKKRVEAERIKKEEEEKDRIEHPEKYVVTGVSDAAVAASVTPVKQTVAEPVTQDKEAAAAVSNSSSSSSSNEGGAKSWARLVNSKQTTESLNLPTVKPLDFSKPFGQMDIKGNKETTTDEEGLVSGTAGQFDDDESSDSEDEFSSSGEEFEFEKDDDKGEEKESDDDDDDNYAASDADISDEECEIYVLDEEEVEARKAGKTINITQKDNKEVTFKDSDVEKKFNNVEEELTEDFPSLSAAATVEYISDEEQQPSEGNNLVETEEEAEERKRKALTPLLVNGKFRYQSFSKYKDLMPQDGSAVSIPASRPKQNINELPKVDWDEEEKTNGSRIMGSGNAGVSNVVDDDGEGWVNVSNIKSSKNGGNIGNSTFFGDKNSVKSVDVSYNSRGPKKEERCACATTDFAMQNVLLQMGLKLISLDGVAIRRTKSWVTRCGACYAVYSSEKGGSMLFCGRCGNSNLQRVACSIDGKTGKMKLHLQKNRRSDVRGTKFSLPKSGKQNRFAGDLLLREDQLMMGQWNQKVRKGKKVVSSMFGEDIIDNVGLGDLSKRTDIMVGLGKQNPNSSKFGRERRGKGTKGKEQKTCAMRRNF